MARQRDSKLRASLVSSKNGSKLRAGRMNGITARVGLYTWRKDAVSESSTGEGEFNGIESTLAESHALALAGGLLLVDPELHDTEVAVRFHIPHDVFE